MIRYFLAGVAAVVLVWVLIAASSTEESEITIPIGPGDTSPGAITSTSSIANLTHVTSYTDTLTDGTGWRTLNLGDMTDVATIFIKAVDDSTGNVANIELTSNAAAIDFYLLNQLTINQAPDSAAANQVTQVRIAALDADGVLTYHVILTGK
jgi:hypothetical protein